MPRDNTRRNAMAENNNNNNDDDDDLVLVRSSRPKWLTRPAPLAPTHLVSGNQVYNQWPKFPEILYQMLNDLDAIGDYNAITWAPHGHCVVFPNKELFVTHYMPLWFRFGNWSSFQRQLNLYGFRRIGAGIEKNGYWHPNFKRCNWDVVPELKRDPKKGTKRKAAPPPPNFYLEESRPPLPDEPVRPIVEFILGGLELPPGTARPTRRGLRIMYNREQFEASMVAAKMSWSDPSELYADENTSSDGGGDDDDDLEDMNQNEEDMDHDTDSSSTRTVDGTSGNGTNQPGITTSKTVGTGTSTTTTTTTTTTHLMEEARVPPNVTLLRALSMRRLPLAAARANSGTTLVNQALQAPCPLRPTPFTTTAGAVGGPILQPAPTKMQVLVPVVAGLVPVATTGSSPRNVVMRRSMESSHLSSQRLMQSFATSDTGGCGGWSTGPSPSLYQYALNGTCTTLSGGDADMETLITRPFMSFPNTPVTTTRIRQVSNGSRTTTTATAPSPPFLQGTDNKDDIPAPALETVMSSTTHPGQHYGNNKTSGVFGSRHHPGRPEQPRGDDSEEAKTMIPERVESVDVSPPQAAAVAAPERVESRTATSDDSRRGNFISNAVTTALAHTGTSFHSRSGDLSSLVDAMEPIMDVILGGTGTGTVPIPRHQGNNNNDNGPVPVPLVNNDGIRGVLIGPNQERQELEEQEGQRFNGNDVMAANDDDDDDDDDDAIAGEEIGPALAALFDHYDQDPYNDSVVAGDRTSALEDDPLGIDDLDSILFS